MTEMFWERNVYTHLPNPRVKGPCETVPKNHMLLPVKPVEKCWTCFLSNDQQRETTKGKKKKNLMNDGFIFYSSPLQNSNRFALILWPYSEQLYSRTEHNWSGWRTSTSLMTVMRWISQLWWDTCIKVHYCTWLLYYQTTLNIWPSK